MGGLLGFVLYTAELLERRPGRVLVEAPSYDRPLKVLAREGAEIVPLAMDEEGLDPDALEHELGSRRDAPSFLYTIPTFQNPSGRTLSADRRTTRTASSGTRATRRRRSTSSRAASW